MQVIIERSNNDNHYTQAVMLSTLLIERTSKALSKFQTLEPTSIIEGNETRTSPALEFFEDVRNG